MGIWISEVPKKKILQDSLNAKLKGKNDVRLRVLMLLRVKGEDRERKRMNTGSAIKA